MKRVPSCRALVQVKLSLGHWSGLVSEDLSREYKNKRIVIWPVYIDSTASRSEGRKVPQRFAVRKPRPEEIAEAAERLGLNPVIEESRYPREWWEYTKRVVVDKVDSKLKTLKMIGLEVKRLREEKKSKSYKGT